jgi:transposase InsO family protein
VEYFSRSTRPNEKNFHSFELETLAIVEAVKKFRHYLLGREFTIITDCAAVRQAFYKKELSYRIGKWILELNEYQFKIMHRSSNRMRHADALSRNVVTQVGVHSVLIAEDDWLLAAQQSVTEIVTIKEALETGDRTSHKDVFREYALKGGKVYKRTKRGLRWMVPKAIRFQLLRMHHDDVGHLGYEKTLELLSHSYWFRNMRRFTRKYVNHCLNCAYFKTPSGKKPGFLHPIPKLPIPFHTIHVDHLGPFVKTQTGNKYILTIIDAFTKFILIYPVKGTDTQYVIKTMKDMIKLLGVPRRCISDRGTAFTSKRFQNFCQEVGMVHHLTATGLPRGNGQVERYHRTILHSLGSMGANIEDDRWEENVVNIQLGLNGAINKAIGVTPSEALLGFRVRSNQGVEGGELRS